MLCIGAGAAIGSVAIPAWVLFGFVVIGLGYLGLSVRYWFRIPTAGVALGTVCLLSAWLTYASAHL